nr:NAD(P)/FAD-dependent oxidoreductase [Microbacterium pseudoresistens]
MRAQIDAQTDDAVRILIVGAGMAGVTLAQLLRRRGIHPILVDRIDPAGHPGYMLALMPNTTGVFGELGVHDEYARRSVPLRRFRFRSHRGRALRTDDLGGLLASYGDYRGIDRGALLEVLTADGCAITTGLSAHDMQRADGVTRVTLADDTGDTTTVEVDLLVGADGIGSTVRTLLDVGPVTRCRTGWGGWVVWSEDDEDAELAEELWGDGCFVGAYPVLDRIGVFLGGPEDEVRPDAAAFARTVRARLDDPGPRLRGALDAVEHDPEPFFWRLDDVRAARWTVDGAVLLGDAADGFLPTAGIGAAMAMESARVLAAVLAATDRVRLGRSLAVWEARERPRVEKAQANSRTLAKLMFRRGRVVAWLRETVMRVMTVRAALGPIVSLMAESPDPERIAAEIA